MTLNIDNNVMLIFVNVYCVVQYIENDIKHRYG